MDLGDSQQHLVEHLPLQSQGAVVLSPGSHGAEPLEKELFAVHLVSNSPLSSLMLSPLDVEVQSLHRL